MFEENHCKNTSNFLALPKFWKTGPPALMTMHTAISYNLNLPSVTSTSLSLYILLLIPFFSTTCAHFNMIFCCVTDEKIKP